MIRSISTLPDYSNRLRLLSIFMIITWVIFGFIFVMDRLNLSSMSEQNANNTLEISSLKVKQEALENQLAELLKNKEIAPQSSNSPEGTPVSSAASTPGTEIISQVNERTANLEKKLGEVADTLKKSEAGNDSNNLMLMAIHLRDAVRESKSFANEIESIRIAAKDDAQIEENLKILEKNSSHGIASIANLKVEFDQLASTILEDSKRNKENKTLVDKASLPLFSMVKVQKIEADAANNQPDDILARAYKHLLQDDLDGAISEAKTLPEEPKKMASEWIEKAESNIAARAASEKIFAYAAKRSYANNQASY
jgi:hypothetical protein